MNTFTRGTSAGVRVVLLLGLVFLLPRRVVAQAEIVGASHARFAATAHVTHRPVTLALENVPIVIDATVQCPKKCDATVYYREQPATEWLSAPMVPARDLTHLRAALSPMPAGTVEYFIIVADENLDKMGTDGSEKSPHLIRLVPRALPARTAGQIRVRRTSEPFRPGAGRYHAGVALAVAGGVLLVASVVLGALSIHENVLIHNGSFATGAELGAGIHWSQQLSAAAVICGVSGVVLGGSGVTLVLTSKGSR